MSDFTNEIWSVYITLITLTSIIACAVLLKASSIRRAGPDQHVGTTGQTWNEDLTG